MTSASEIYEDVVRVCVLMPVNNNIFTFLVSKSNCPVQLWNTFVNKWAACPSIVTNPSSVEQSTAIMMIAYVYNTVVKPNGRRIDVDKAKKYMLETCKFNMDDHTYPSWLGRDFVIPSKYKVIKMICVKA